MPISYDSQSEFIWIAPQDRMPDVCVHCGMFTDRRVAVKHPVFVEKSKDESFGCVAVILVLVLHIALGPIGSLISAFSEGDDPESETRLVREKVKIKLPQCQLCRGSQPPEVVDVEHSPQRLMFLVHPQFKVRFQEQNRSEPEDKALY